jgi:hypothetical protein
MVVGPDLPYTPTAAARSARIAREADDAAGQLRAEFFDQVLDELRTEPRAWRLAARGRTSIGTPIVRPIPEGQIWATFLASEGRLRIDLYLDHPDSDIDRRIFDDMYANREQIEVAAGQPLSWEREVRQGRGSRVAAYTDATVGDLDNRSHNVAWCARQIDVITDGARRATP